MAIIPNPLLTYARRAYLRLPLSQGTKLLLVHGVYRTFGPLFRDTPHYENWRRNIDGRGALTAPPPTLEARPLESILSTLAFKQPARPLVSILIPTYGKLDLTARCLATLQATIDPDRCEVIVVEDASGDADIARLAAVPGLRYTVNASNLGFVGTCNRAASMANGEWLVFLNNDTQPQAGWLDALLDTFAHFPDAGLVGAKLLYPDGRLQEAGGIVWSDGSAWNYGRDHAPQRGDYSYVRRTDYCSGAALMIARSFFDDLGQFSQAFAPAYYEDTDLAFKVRAAGRQVYVQPHSIVVHLEGASAGTDTSTGMKAYQVRNREVFRLKWQRALVRQYPHGSTPRRAAQRLDAGRVIIVIDHYLPRPDRDAGSRSVTDIIDGLLAQGWVVKFWPHNLWYDAEYARPLERRGVEIFHGHEYANRFGAVLQELGDSVHAVFLNRPEVAVEYLGDIERQGNIRVVYYGHDIHHARMRMQRDLRSADAPSEGDIERMARIETKLWARAHVTMYPSHSETQRVRAEVPDANTVHVPLYAFDTFPDPGGSQSRETGHVVFVANFAHPPNVDAVEWLVRDIWPLIIDCCPHARLSVVGASPTAAVHALAGPTVDVLGPVSAEALDALYARARIAVVPLRYGAGVKGKVVEALRSGLPLVTTPVGAQGIPGIDETIDIVDSPEAFAGAVVRLMTDDAAWAATSRAMQALAKAQFSREALAHALKAAFGSPPPALASPGPDR